MAMAIFRPTKPTNQNVHTRKQSLHSLYLVCRESLSAKILVEDVPVGVVVTRGVVGGDQLEFRRPVCWDIGTSKRELSHPLRLIESSSQDSVVKSG